MRAAYTPYRLEFKEPGGTSRGVLTHKDTYFVKLWHEDSPETFGIGECALFRGLSAEDNAGYEPKLRELCRNICAGNDTCLHGFSSIVFGLETARLDLANGGRRICYPSAFVRGEQEIPINGLVWMGSKQEMACRIDAKLDAGFSVIKLKIGAIDFESELDLVRYLRSRYSESSLTIRVDANGGFSPQEALAKLGRLSRYGIHSCEQPIKAGQWQQMAAICAAAPVPVALDEELIGDSDVPQMQALLEAIKPQYVVLKPSLCGGFQGARRWLEQAAERKTGAWITSALESNIGLNALAQWTATLHPTMAQGLGTGALFTNNIASPLEQRGQSLRYNPHGQWQLPPFHWIEG